MGTITTKLESIKDATEDAKTVAELLSEYRQTETNQRQEMIDLLEEIRDLLS